MIIVQDGRRYDEKGYSAEKEFERDIVERHRAFFGKDAVYVDAKHKIAAQALGGSIPDGFLFDMSDPESREFYLVEIELAGHDFYRHIFPQITRFFAFFKNSTRQKELVEKLFATINTDAALKKRLKKYLGEEEIFKWLSDLVDSSQNILLVIDGEKAELPEITDTYSDTWGKMVKVLTVKRYAHGTERLFTVDPEFESIPYSITSVGPPPGDGPVTYTEEFHLDGVGDNVKAIYGELKKGVAQADPAFVFNCQKHYISIRRSRNVVFVNPQKKKLRLVVMLPEDVVHKGAKHHTVRPLSESVQRFFNGPCAALYVADLGHFDEVMSLVGKAMAQDAAAAPDDS